MNFDFPNLDHIPAPTWPEYGYAVEPQDKAQRIVYARTTTPGDNAGVPAHVAIPISAIAPPVENIEGFARDLNSLVYDAVTDLYVTEHQCGIKSARKALGPVDALHGTAVNPKGTNA